MTTPSREELQLSVDDLTAELDSVRDAKVAAERETLEAEARVSAASEELRQTRRFAV